MEQGRPLAYLDNLTHTSNHRPMKAILCTLGLILTMATSFSQSAEKELIPNDPDSKLAASIAQQFADKLVAEDFKGAAKMMSDCEPKSDPDGKAQRKQSKSDFVKTKEQDLERTWSQKGGAGSAEVFSVANPAEPRALPEGSKEYSVQVNFKRTGSDKIDPDRVSVVKLPAGGMTVWRILD